jgi:hypothetical protein
MGYKDKDLKKNKAEKSNKKLKQEKGFTKGISNLSNLTEYLVIYKIFISMVREYHLRIRKESTLRVKVKVMQGGRGGGREVQ